MIWEENHCYDLRPEVLPERVGITGGYDNRSEFYVKEGRDNTPIIAYRYIIRDDCKPISGAFKLPILNLLQILKTDHSFGCETMGVNEVQLN